MKIGFITNSLAWAGMKDLDEIAVWASDNGFKDMEVGPGIPLDQKAFETVRQKTGIEISAFIYCRNFLSEDLDVAERHKKALLERIEFAPKVGISKIICSTGVTKESMLKDNPVMYDPEASLDAVAEAFKEVIELAEKNNVKLCFENCPIMGNISISPYMWDVLFDRLGSDKAGIVYDPSHLVWQLMDPYSVIMKYKDRIFHVHGKDCEVNFDKLKQVGILHSFSQKVDEVKEGENELKKMWWRYRLPGLGDLNWNKIISNLQEAGFDGTISIEHEDPVWEGTMDKVKTGLLKAKKHIESFL